jgi:hypothetical protein
MAVISNVTLQTATIVSCIAGTDFNTVRARRNRSLNWFAEVHGQRSAEIVAGKSPTDGRDERKNGEQDTVVAGRIARPGVLRKRLLAQRNVLHVVAQVGRNIARAHGASGYEF